MPGGFNRIITRGMGTSRGAAGRVGMVSQGYAGLDQIALEQLRNIVRAGKSGIKRVIRELDEIVVWAKLVRLNDETPPVKIEGSVKIDVKATTKHVISLVEHVSTRVQKTWEYMKVSAWRLK